MIRDVVKKSINVNSRIQVKHVDDINNFLLSCAYKSDGVLFNKSDYWQTPIELEENRCRDCEDFALWTWAKLLDIGKESRPTSGTDEFVGHVWITLFKYEEPFIYETTLKLEDGKTPILPALKLMIYKPIFSKDKKLYFYQHIE